MGIVEEELVGDARDYGPLIDHEARPSLPGPKPQAHPSRANATDLTPHDVPNAARNTEEPKRACQCFTFATWDDEEELKGRGKLNVL